MNFYQAIHWVFEDAIKSSTCCTRKSTFFSTAYLSASLHWKKTSQVTVNIWLKHIGILILPNFQVVWCFNQSSCKLLFFYIWWHYLLVKHLITSQYEQAWAFSSSLLKFFKQLVSSHMVTRWFWKLILNMKYRNNTTSHKNVYVFERIKMGES